MLVTRLGALPSCSSVKPHMRPKVRSAILGDPEQAQDRVPNAIHGVEIAHGTKLGGTPMQYQTLRSVSDNHVFVVCRKGEFYSLPDHVRQRGPRQGMHRGEIERLKPEYWLYLQDHRDGQRR
jgi:hypothetical protein